MEKGFINFVKVLAIGSIGSYFYWVGVPNFSRFEKDCSVLLDCLQQGNECKELKKIYKSCYDKNKIKEYKLRIKNEKIE